MQFTTKLSRAALVAVVGGAVAAPMAHAGPAQETGNGCVMMARSCLTMDQVRQIDMHASTVHAPKGNDVVPDARGEAVRPQTAPKPDAGVADVRTEAAKPENPPVIKGVPVFPTDTTPIAAPKPQPVATTGDDGDGTFDWPLAGLIAAAAAVMGGAAFAAGRQVRAHAAH